MSLINTNNTCSGIQASVSHWANVALTFPSTLAQGSAAHAPIIIGVDLIAHPAASHGDRCACPTRLPRRDLSDVLTGEGEPGEDKREEELKARSEYASLLPSFSCFVTASQSLIPSSFSPAFPLSFWDWQASMRLSAPLAVFQVYPRNCSSKRTNRTTKASRFPLSILSRAIPPIPLSSLWSPS